MALKNYHIKRDLDKGELKRALGYALVLAVFFAMVIFYVSQAILKLHLENEINRKIVLRNRLLRSNRELRLEYSSLRSLSSIENKARHRLGLTDPQPGQIILFNPETLTEER